jgi:hypothetical protein
MKKNIIFYLLIYSMLIAFWGCATTTKGGMEESLKPPEATSITGIDIQDYAVTIKANRPFIYTIYRPNDPYKIVVDLPDVDIGSFNNRIVSDKAGITEIIPSQIKAPSFMAKLEMLLQTPSIVEQEYKNNVLKIKIKEEPPKEISPVALKEKEEASKIEKEVIPEPAPVEQKPLPKATEITGISFEKSAETVDVLVKGNGSMIPNVFPLGDRIVIDIPSVVMNATLPEAVLSPVKGIRSGKYPDKVRLVIDLKEKTNFDISAIGDSIVIALQRAEKEAAPLAIAQITKEATEATTEGEEVKEPEILTKGRCKDFLEGKENINLDFQDQDIGPILMLFARISGCNLFLHPDVKGKCTMQFNNVPWNQALDTILKSFSLGKSVEGNVIRIAPHTIFAKESEEATKAKEAGIKAEPLETKIFPISYADVNVVETSIKNSKILTPRGSISVDVRTSVLSVTVLYTF